MKPEVIVFMISILSVFLGFYIREYGYYISHRDRAVGAIFIHEALRLGFRQQLAPLIHHNYTNWPMGRAVMIGDENVNK